MRSEGDRADLRSGQLTMWNDPFHYLKIKINCLWNERLGLLPAEYTKKQV